MFKDFVVNLPREFEQTGATVSRGSRNLDNSRLLIKQIKDYN